MHCRLISVHTKVPGDIIPSEIALQTYQALVKRLKEEASKNKGMHEVLQNNRLGLTWTKLTIIEVPYQKTYGYFFWKVAPAHPDSFIKCCYI
jgi:hypothetical protein